MLRIVEGQPGAGKTYYCVKYLSRYVEFDKLYNVYVLRSDVLLVTNIDDIKVRHMSIVDFIQGKYYYVDNLRQYLKENHYRQCVIICDEAQKYISKEAMKVWGIDETELYFLFEYHRHLGCDIFLVCQTISAIPKRIVQIAEYVIRARQLSISLPGVFIYDILDSVTGERIQSLKLKKENDVFMLYRSFDIKGMQASNNFLLRKWVMGIGLVVVPLLLAVSLLTSGFLFSGLSPSSQSAKKATKNEYSPQNPVPLQAEHVEKSEKGQQELSRQSVPKQEQVRCLDGACARYFLTEAYVEEYQGAKPQGRVCYDGRCYFFLVKQEKSGGEEGAQ